MFMGSNDFRDLILQLSKCEVEILHKLARLKHCAIILPKTFNRVLLLVVFRAKPIEKLSPIKEIFWG